MKVTKKFKGGLKSAIKKADELEANYKPMDGVQVEDEQSNIIYDTHRNGYECAIGIPETKAQHKLCGDPHSFYWRRIRCF